jgi:cytochrome b
MSLAYRIFSIVIILLSLAWLASELSQRRLVQWHFLAAGGVNFIAAMVINRQFTQRQYNYLGMVHVVFMVLFFGYGYFFI